MNWFTSHMLPSIFFVFSFLDFFAIELLVRYENLFPTLWYS